MYFFPPLEVFTKLLGVDTETLKKPGTVEVPTEIFRMLLVSALSELELSAKVYKDENRDIAKQYAGGPDSEALSHYRKGGYFEGRRMPIVFDKDYYVTKYPDVVSAKSRVTPEQHFFGTGIFELRSPNAEAETEAKQWAHCVATATKLPSRKK